MWKIYKLRLYFIYYFSLIFGPVLIAEAKILISAINNKVKIAKNKKNVNCTEPTDKWDVDIFVGNIHCTVHGCLPTSATTHHNSWAIKAKTKAKSFNRDIEIELSRYIPYEGGI